MALLIGDVALNVLHDPIVPLPNFDSYIMTALFALQMLNFILICVGHLIIKCSFCKFIKIS